MKILLQTGIGLLFFSAFCCYVAARIVWEKGFSNTATVLLLLIGVGMLLMYIDKLTPIAAIWFKNSGIEVVVVILTPVVLFLTAIGFGIGKRDKEKEELNTFLKKSEKD